MTNHGKSFVVKILPRLGHFLIILAEHPHPSSESFSAMVKNATGEIVTLENLDAKKDNVIKMRKALCTSIGDREYTILQRKVAEVDIIVNAGLD